MILELKDWFYRVGRDGLITLFLSNMLICVSAGLSLGWQCWRVQRVARRAATGVPAELTIVVLGKRLIKDEVGSDYVQRLERARRLYSENPERRILIVGGTTGRARVSEAVAGREYLISRGVDVSRISTEASSMHTLENLSNARHLLRTSRCHGFVLVSSRYHLARSGIIADGLGMQPVLCAAEEVFSITPRHLFHLLLEAYYVHWYRTVSIWSRVTKNTKSLARIQ